MADRAAPAAVEADSNTGGLIIIDGTNIRASPLPRKRAKRSQLLSLKVKPPNSVRHVAENGRAARNRADRVRTARLRKNSQKLSK